MTTLQITPNWKNKTARFKGTIAAGEHVAVSIANDDNYITDTTNLRLRVVNPANGKTLAQFPMWTADNTDEWPEGVTQADAWDSDLTPLQCTLDLNTDRMLMAVPPGANVPLLFVLDAYEGATDEDEGEFTLYFKDMCEVTHWPRRRGEDEPTRLDDYKDLIEDFDTRLTTAEESIADAVADVNTAVTSTIPSALGQIDGKVATAVSTQLSGKVDKVPGKGLSTNDYDATEKGKVATALQPADIDSTLSTQNKAADAKATGDALGRLNDLVSAAGGRFVVVQALPAAAEADPKAVYLVPRSPGETNNIYDEYLRVEAAPDGYAWERIGSTDIDLSGYVQTGDPRLSDARAPVAHVHAQSDVTGLGDALAARPTKAQLDAGWWSEWTVTCNGVDVTSQVPQPARYVSDVLGWDVPTEYPTAMFGDTLYDDTTGYDEDALLLEWTSSAGTWTAARHRVSAPVPTKPENIGAASVDDVTLLAIYSPEPGSPPKGYVLGTQQDKPLQPQGDYAPATNIAKTALASGVQASLGKADTAVQPAALADYATTSALRYDFHEVSVDDGDVVAEAYLHDRVVNLVTIKNLAQTEMCFYFPPVVNGKVRDFAVVFTIDATNSSTDVAPPQFTFENYTFVNADGEMPEIATAPAGDKATTLLYFSEVDEDVFLFKAEIAKEVA